jgi:hypothetical protein
MNLSRHIATGLATALVCLGCSSDAVTSEQSDLRPLVTTGVGQTTTTVARTIPTPDFGGFPNPPDPTRPMTPQERDYVERVFGSLPVARRGTRLVYYLVRLHGTWNEQDEHHRMDCGNGEQ